MEQGLTAKPYFPWIGGKEKLIPIICPVFPPGMPRYGEHFGGSGSILLADPRSKDESKSTTITMPTCQIFFSVFGTS